MIERSGDMPNDTKIVDTVSRRIVRDELEKTNRIKHIPAIVTEVPADKKNGVAKVFTLGRTLTLLNKSGELLKVGDGVVIHYWDNIANGYIALRCGLPVFKIDSGGGEIYSGELPLHEETEINKAYVLCEHNQDTEVSYSYSYDTNAEQVASTSFTYGDYNAISSVATRDPNYVDYKARGSGGIDEIYWSSAFFPDYNDISYNFTPFTSATGQAVQNDTIVPYSVRVVKNPIGMAVGIYVELVLNGNTTYYYTGHYGDRNLEDYGLVLYLSHADSYNTHRDIEYNRKVNAMVYNANIRFAYNDSSGWHFIPGDWGFETISLAIVIPSNTGTIYNTVCDIEQTETITS